MLYGKAEAGRDEKPAEGKGGDGGEEKQEDGGDAAAADDAGAGGEDEGGAGGDLEAAVRARQAWRVRRMVERVPGECLQRRWAPGYENSVSYVLSGKHAALMNAKVGRVLKIPQPELEFQRRDLKIGGC